MHGPATAGWALAALCGLTGGYCLLRLCLRRLPGQDRLSDGAEALMGLGMAAMALPGAIAARLPVAAWAAVFGAAAVASLAGARGRAHRGHHLYHAAGHLTMVYMTVLGTAGSAVAGNATGVGVGGAGMAGMAGMRGMGAGGSGLAGWSPVVTGALLLLFGGHAIWTTSRLVLRPSASAGTGRGSAPPSAPGSATDAATAATCRASGPTSGAGRGLLERAREAAVFRPPMAGACRTVMGLGMVAMLLGA